MSEHFVELLFKANQAELAGVDSKKQVANELGNMKTAKTYLCFELDVREGDFFTGCLDLFRTHRLKVAHRFETRGYRHAGDRGVGEIFRACPEP